MIVKKVTLIVLIATTVAGVVKVTAGPSLQFANSTNTGLSSPGADTISFDANGEERINIDNTDVTVTATLVTLAPLCLTNLFCRQSVQTYIPASPYTVQVEPNKSVLFINSTAIGLTISITTPANPIDGQLLTIMTQNTNSVNLTYNTGPGGIFYDTSIDSLDVNASLTSYYGGASVTYIYTAARNDWMRFRRG